MRLLESLRLLLKTPRFWVWQSVGVIIYGIPVAIRFITGNVSIPILNWPGYWIGQIIPGNFLEKLLVNSFFPGGAGGVTGEIFFNNYKREVSKGKKKYAARLVGAWTQTLAWSAFQYAGYYLFIMGPYGSNIFEHVIVFPINFALASLSIFTPDIVGFVKIKLTNLHKKLKSNN
ncbi:MAG: hypothetical protein GX638_14790 [Crenarchaeota archaeon]|mgnify:CR=1 FL=1|nr:hypothetical protein [Thermoproteota archaeon]